MVDAIASDTDTTFLRAIPSYVAAGYAQLGESYALHEDAHLAHTLYPYARLQYQDLGAKIARAALAQDHATLQAIIQSNFTAPLAALGTVKGMRLHITSNGFDASYSPTFNEMTLNISALHNQSSEKFMNPVFHEGIHSQQYNRVLQQTIGRSLPELYDGTHGLVAFLGSHANLFANRQRLTMRDTEFISELIPMLGDHMGITKAVTDFNIDPSFFDAENDLATQLRLLWRQLFIKHGDRITRRMRFLTAYFPTLTEQRVTKFAHDVDNPIDSLDPQLFERYLSQATESQAYRVSTKIFTDAAIIKQTEQLLIDYITPIIRDFSADTAVVRKILNLLDQPFNLSSIEASIAILKEAHADDLASKLEIVLKKINSKKYCQELFAPELRHIRALQTNEALAIHCEKLADYFSSPLARILDFFGGSRSLSLFIKCHAPILEGAFLYIDATHLNETLYSNDSIRLSSLVASACSASSFIASLVEVARSLPIGRFSGVLGSMAGVASHFSILQTTFAKADAETSEYVKVIAETTLSAAATGLLICATVQNVPAIIATSGACSLASLALSLV